MSACFDTSSRLYVSVPLAESARVRLEGAQAHYVRNVMRLGTGDSLRLFNGLDGEYAASIESLKKGEAVLVCRSKLREQIPVPESLSLVFAPIRKNRLDFMIEKAVELGVTDLHPVFTAHTQMRNLNEERLRAQIIEAAEQCERLDIPVLHKAATLKEKMAQWEGARTLHFAAERLQDAPVLSQSHEASAFLIGPEGGFSEEETDFISNLAFVRPVSLGPRILRADTAAVVCLALARRPVDKRASSGQVFFTTDS